MKPTTLLKLQLLKLQQIFKNTINKFFKDFKNVFLMRSRNSQCFNSYLKMRLKKTEDSNNLPIWSGNSSTKSTIIIWYGQKILWRFYSLISAVVNKIIQESRNLWQYRYKLKPCVQITCSRSHFLISRTWN